MAKHDEACPKYLMPIFIKTYYKIMYIKYERTINIAWGIAWS